MKPDDIPFDAEVVERGVGFFETMLLLDRRVSLWPEHVARLLETLARFDLPAPAEDAIARAARAAITEDGEKTLRLSWIALGRDLDTPAAWRLDASMRAIPASSLERRRGCRAMTLPPDYRRDSPELKSTSYLSSVLGLRLARKNGADEALFTSEDGNYLEGTSTGLVAWHDGALIAPEKRALPSVTARAFVASTSPRSERRSISREELLEGAIVLGALTKAAPLLSLDGEACAQPAAMLERIGTFNRELETGASAP